MLVLFGLFQLGLQMGDGGLCSLGQKHRKYVRCSILRKLSCIVERGSRY